MPKGYFNCTPNIGYYSCSYSPVVWVRNPSTYTYFHCLECNNLKSTTETRFPNAFIIVSTMTPPGTSWIRLAQTEIIEVC